MALPRYFTADQLPVIDRPAFVNNIDDAEIIEQERKVGKKNCYYYIRPKSDDSEKFVICLVKNGKMETKLIGTIKDGQVFILGEKGFFNVGSVNRCMKIEYESCYSVQDNSIEAAYFTSDRLPVIDRPAFINNIDDVKIIEQEESKAGKKDCYYYIRPKSDDSEMFAICLVKNGKMETKLIGTMKDGQVFILDDKGFFNVGSVDHCMGIKYKSYFSVQDNSILAPLNFEGVNTKLDVIVQYLNDKHRPLGSNECWRRETRSRIVSSPVLFGDAQIVSYTAIIFSAPSRVYTTLSRTREERNKADAIHSLLRSPDFTSDERLQHLFRAALEIKDHKECSDYYFDVQKNILFISLFYETITGVRLSREEVALLSKRPEPPRIRTSDVEVQRSFRR